MKSLLFFSLFFLGINTGMSFAQAAHYAGTAGSSASYSSASYNNASNYSSNYSSSSYSSSANSSNNSSSYSSPAHNQSASQSAYPSSAPVNNSAAVAYSAGNNAGYSNDGAVNTRYYGNNTSIPVSNGSSPFAIRVAVQAPAIYSYAAKTTGFAPSSRGAIPNEIRKDREKCDKENIRHQFIKRMYKVADAIPWFSSLCYPWIFYNDYYYSIVESEPANYIGSSALNVSLEGQIVYGNDTLYGIVTLSNNNVFMERPAGEKQSFGLRFRYSDKNLKSVTVYNGDDELFLARVSVTDNKLSRVIRLGKLSVFDDLYSFSGITDEHALRVLYDGTIHTLGGFVVLDMKQKLVNIVNKVYGTRLNPAGFSTTQQVIDYINRYDRTFF
jgi:hypothetical protein